MITLEIPETGTKFNMPSDLSECDSRQYNEISFLIYQLQQKEIVYEVFRVRAVYALLNMKPVESDNKEHQEEKMVNIYRLSELVDDFFEDIEGEDTKILKQYYVHNPVQRIKCLLTSYYGPTDDFGNIQFGEYIDALHLFTEYHSTKDNGFLYQLMATMYRPYDKKGNDPENPEDFIDDNRQMYNEYLVPKRAKKFKRLYFGEVYGFYLLFASFQKYLSSAKIYWQGRELDLSILFNSDTKVVESDVPGIGMKSTLYTLAESGVFGTIKELRRESLWEILLRMYDLTKRDLDHKALQDSLKPKK